MNAIAYIIPKYSLKFPETRPQALLDAVSSAHTPLLGSCFWWTGFPGGSEVKVSASNAGDPGSIPASGRSPGEGNGKPMEYHSSILAWRIPWTEKPGRLQSTGSQRVGHDRATSPSPSPSGGQRLAALGSVGGRDESDQRSRGQEVQ